MTRGLLVPLIVLLILLDFVVLFVMLRMRRERFERNSKFFTGRGYKTFDKKDRTYRQLLREVSDALGIRTAFPYFGLLAEFGEGSYFFEFVVPSRYSVWVYYGLLQRSVDKLEPLPDFEVRRRNWLSRLVRSGTESSFEKEFSVKPPDLLKSIPNPYEFTEFVFSHAGLHIKKDGGRLVLVERSGRRLSPEEAFQKAQRLTELKDRVLALLS